MASQSSFLKDDHAGTLAQAAFRFVLNHPGVTTVLGGFSSIEQLDELATVSNMPPLSEEKLSRLEKLWDAGFGAST